MISLAASDEYASRVNVTQTDEKYYVIFKETNGSDIARTGTSGDLPDRVAYGKWAGKVNNNLTLLKSATKIRVQHAKLTHESPNSLNPSCMLIQPIASPENPQISIDKTDDNSEQDKDGTIGNDTQTILV
jgi:hypothetical protein